MGMGFGVLCFSLLRAVVAKEGSSGTQALWDQRVPGCSDLVLFGFSWLAGVYAWGSVYCLGLASDCSRCAVILRPVSP